MDFLDINEKSKLTEASTSNQNEMKTRVVAELPGISPPQWTEDELGYLMELCENKEQSWESYAMRLAMGFKDRPFDFFTAETCTEKYRRLSGESGGKPADNELLKWIKEFLKKPFGERYGKDELYRLARCRRFYELSQHATKGHLTEDQFIELVGFDRYNSIITGKVVEPDSAERDRFLKLDLIHSKLSPDDWKNARNPKELITKMKTQPVNVSRLVFEHPAEELQRYANESRPAFKHPVEHPTENIVEEPQVANVDEQISDESSIQVLTERIEQRSESPKPVKIESQETIASQVPAKRIKKVSTPKASKKKKLDPLAKSHSFDSFSQDKPIVQVPAVSIKHEPQSQKPAKIGRQSQPPSLSIQKITLIAAHADILSDPRSSVFKKPVDFKGYSTVIKKPMDLSTIRQLIDNDTITDLSQLDYYCTLMFTNAIMFNPEKHGINKDARKLKLFAKEIIENHRNPSARKTSLKLGSNKFGFKG